MLRPFFLEKIDHSWWMFRFFFLPGGGEGRAWGARKGAGVGFLLKIPGRGGGSPRRTGGGGVEGFGWCVCVCVCVCVGNLGGGGGGKISFRGQNSQQEFVSKKYPPINPPHVALGCTQGGRTLREDVFLPSKHLLSAFYTTLPSKNPSKNLFLYNSIEIVEVPSKNPSKKHLLLENLLRILLRSVRLHDPLGVHPIHLSPQRPQISSP